MTRPRYARTGCIVPFCRRTSTLFPGEWVCGEHWRLIERSLKRFRTRRLRQISRVVEVAEAKVAAAQADLAVGGSEDVVWAAVDRASNARRRWRRTERAIWRRMRAQAIERAAGAAL